MPLANGSNKFFLLFFCVLLFEGTFTSFFLDKSQKEVTKQKEIWVFLLFFLDDRRIRIHTSEAQKHTDPTEPDPQHWYNTHLGIFDDEDLVLRDLVAFQPADELRRLAREHRAQNQLDLPI